MIQMYQVTKSYLKGDHALEGITLKINRGDFALLTGPSGAGKSTLLKLLTCQEALTSGQILVDGRNIVRAKNYAINQIRRNTGVVFQDFKLLNNRTILENVALPCEILGIKKREVKHKGWNALKKVNLEKKMNCFPLQLSGGEQQRVAVARALINEPDILLADEPTGNLDSKSSENILDLFEEANRKGTTVLLATHDKTIINNFKGEIFHLEKGKIVS